MFRHQYQYYTGHEAKERIKTVHAFPWMHCMTDIDKVCYKTCDTQRGENPKDTSYIAGSVENVFFLNQFRYSTSIAANRYKRLGYRKRIRHNNVVTPIAIRQNSGASDTGTAFLSPA